MEERPDPHSVEVRAHRSAVMLGESSDLVLLSREGLHDLDVGNRFLKMAVDIGDALLDVAIRNADPSTKTAGNDDHKRPGGHKEQREAPVDPGEKNENEEEGYDVGQDFRHTGCNELLERVDIIGYAGHQIAGAAIVEEAEALPLHVFIQSASQLEDHALPGM